MCDVMQPHCHIPSPLKYQEEIAQGVDRADESLSMLSLLVPEMIP